MLKHSLGNLLFAAFCAVFGAIYESFSFGVFSFSMIYAFAFPLAVGIFLLIMFIRGKMFGRIFLNLLNAASATAAFGCLAAGVVEIYGSGNHLLIIYPIAAGILFAAAIAVYIADKLSTKKQRAEIVLSENTKRGSV